MREYGSQRFEQHWQSEKKEASASGPAPHDDHRDKNDDDDDLQEQNRNLRGKLLAMEAAMKDAGKTTRAALTLRDTITPTPPSTKEPKNVRAALVAANLRTGELEKAATASSHHLAGHIKPDLENVRAALVVANVRNGEWEKAATASSHHHHLPCPIRPELEKKRASAGSGECEDLPVGDSCATVFPSSAISYTTRAGECFRSAGHGECEEWRIREKSR